MYAVVSYYIGETGDSQVWIFNTEEEAIKYMNKFWETSFNWALEDVNFNENDSYHEEYYAEVCWDDNLKRVFEVVKINEKFSLEY